MQDLENIAQVIIEELNQLNINEQIELSLNNMANITFEDLKIDSLETIQFTLSLEDRLKIELEMTEFPKSATLAEFAEFIMLLKK